ncbi:MAG TPA: DUF5131 family protein [Stellaceae bacterium]
MGANTKIEWAHHTFNPWVGCTRISPACDHCYAATWAIRTGHPALWEGERRRTSSANWQQPLKWDHAAVAAGKRLRVFCGSLMDFADNQVPSRWRDDAWHRIDQCRNLDWMILSKRPQNYLKMLPDRRAGLPEWGNHGWPHVWLGTTVEDRSRLRNIDHLRTVPACIRFLSIEPYLRIWGPWIWRASIWSSPAANPGRTRGPHIPIGSVRSVINATQDFTTAEHARRIAAGEAFNTRAVEVDDDALSEFYATLNRSDGPENPLGYQWMYRAGKKLAGRLLDGRLHDDMPGIKDN